MGTKDEYQFAYLDDDRRFADQINGALFQGSWRRRNRRSSIWERDRKREAARRQLLIRRGCGREGRYTYW